ncbi:Abi family protein [Texcoconibacillus texcoconensis]|uniref:Abortive infection bacteriophage resistance protein n=1 Tax=Texcoconibacillus texcoconensis TaxID=1095777 RepID=A0A840QTA4_9BACI|nr:Abi family protein [Texcoconibacillus texcoconensis]MBB5174538.1 abortive infection bacteriophage resistance protein [Texcoconibacillus texcoconensis]
MDKMFSSIEEQMKKLQSRGLILDKHKARIILEMENYYNLINGYKDLFIDHKYEGPDEKYKDGAHFDELYALYLFDRELRNIFIKYILEIENNMKSVLSHDFSKKYGHDNYLKIENFDTSVKKWEKKSKAQKVGEVSELIANLQREVSRQLSRNNPMISHHILTYGYVPLWVLVNTLTLGTISTFYSYLKQKDQNDIGRIFGLKPDEMTKILFVLTIYRNACAHDERFYNLKALKRNMQPNMIKTNRLHKELNVPFNGRNNPTKGKNDLFAIVIISKLILKEESFKHLCELINLQIDELSSRINTIEIDVILEKMGFPSTWYDISKL